MDGNCGFGLALKDELQKIREQSAISSKLKLGLDYKSQRISLEKKIDSLNEAVRESYVLFNLVKYAKTDLLARLTRKKTSIKDT